METEWAGVILKSWEENFEIVCTNKKLMGDILRAKANQLRREGTRLSTNQSVK